MRLVNHLFMYSRDYHRVNMVWTRHKPRGVFTIPLLMAGDIETCLECRKTININQQSYMCVRCKTLHSKCLYKDPKTGSTCLKRHSCLELHNQVNEYNTESNGGLMADACFQEFHYYLKLKQGVL